MVPTSPECPFTEGWCSLGIISVNERKYCTMPGEAYLSPCAAWEFSLPSALSVLHSSFERAGITSLLISRKATPSVSCCLLFSSLVHQVLLSGAFQATQPAQLHLFRRVCVLFPFPGVPFPFLGSFGCRNGMGYSCLVVGAGPVLTPCAAKWSKRAGC